MKLRAFTDEEVNEVLADMDRLWQLSGLITAEARRRIEEAFKNHVNEYTWKDVLNPFTSKIKSFNSMVEKITSYKYAEFDTTGSAYLEARGFREFLSTSNLTQENTCYFTEKKYNDLINLAVRVGKLNINKLKCKQYMLEKFVERPVAFEEEEILLFDFLKSYLITLEKDWKDYNDAL